VQWSRLTNNQWSAPATLAATGTDIIYATGASGGGRFLVEWSRLNDQGIWAMTYTNGAWGPEDHVSASGGEPVWPAVSSSGIEAIVGAESQQGQKYFTRQPSSASWVQGPDYPGHDLFCVDNGFSLAFAGDVAVGAGSYAASSDAPCQIDAFRSDATAPTPTTTSTSTTTAIVTTSTTAGRTTSTTSAQCSKSESPATLSPAAPQPGDRTTVTGQCFTPGSPVTATIFSTPIVVGNYTANAAGTVSGTFVMPNLPPGRHQIELTGPGNGGTHVAAATFSVGTLVRTGTASGQAARAGMALMGVGAVLIATASSKRPTGDHYGS
jgi:hypothetical protein